MIRINLNAKCWVTLTEHGLAVYRRYHTDLNCPAPALPENNELATQLWDLFCIFGSSTFMGNHKMFDNNEVRFQ